CRALQAVCFEVFSLQPQSEHSPHAGVVLLHTRWSQGRSIMKHALIAIAGVGILAATVGVETANAQDSPPPPPSYTPPPASRHHRLPPHPPPPPGPQPSPRPTPTPAEPPVDPPANPTAPLPRPPTPPALVRRPIASPRKPMPLKAPARGSGTLVPVRRNGPVCASLTSISIAVTATKRRARSHARSNARRSTRSRCLPA